MRRILQGKRIKILSFYIEICSYCSVRNNITCTKHTKEYLHGRIFFNFIYYLCGRMGRIVAIDYGYKRTGLAVTDPLKLIAGRLVALPGSRVVSYLKEYVQKENVELFLLGEPRQMNYQHSENMHRVAQFKKKLQEAIPLIDINMVDERFTSVLAHRAMLEGGLKKKERRNKELVDELSATIMLQSHLESIKK